MSTWRVAVVGATGVAGHQFLAALDHHPWFELVALAASERSAGKTLSGLPVQRADTLDLAGIDIVFSAVSSEAARMLEPRYAKTTAVISTASAFRYEDDVPILVPGVNVVMTSMQGVSGAGRSPGVQSLDILDNVIPYIPGEEEKVARETGKILGAAFPVSATCTRAAVTEGHTEAVTASLGVAATPADLAHAFREFGAELKRLELPSAPERLITVHDDPFRPQPRLDRDADGGMTTSVGRIRGDQALEHGIKYVLVSHNAKMGAAKGAVLTAEYLVRAGYV